MSGCWLWTGGVNEHGYGIFWTGAKLMKAHRFSFCCDNPPCVNPDHLYAGSAQINVDDMWRRQRATVQRRRGTSQTQAKLDDSKASAIRELWATGLWRQRDIAAEFDVSQGLVWRVIHGRNWFAPSGVVIETGRGK